MRYLGLQAGRGIAACLVVLHHISGKLVHAQPDAPLFLGGFFDFGWVGVDFFFVLSGFIIAHTLSSRPTAQDFMVRRLIRVYPPFWVAFAGTLLIALLLPSLRSSVQNFTPWQWVLGITLLPSGHNEPVIGVAWTLHHEVFFYAMAGLWIIAPRTVLAVATVLLAMPLFAAQTTFPSSFFASALHWEFVFGILAYLAHRRIGPRTAGWVCLGGLFWLLVTCALVTPFNYAEGRLRVFQFGIGFGILALGVAALEHQKAVAGQHSAGLLTRLGEKLGEWSFALYLLHIPIILATLKAGAALGIRGGGLVHGAGMLAFLLCIAAAAIYYRGVERPLLKKLLAAQHKPLHAMAHQQNHLEA
ncbi:acyltransferase family protein [Aquabacterium sp.]|uniref:acyltransferase family protein n=1 Tax=Aquabacterium sp. TaxID=1872578 RepID=UPI003D6D1C95